MALSSPTRRRAVSLSGVLAAGLAVVAIPAEAQTRAGGYAWTLELATPSATQSTLEAGEGMAWDDFRQNGLVLSARGSGQASLVLHVLTLDDGRVIGRWKSASFAATPGRTALPGKYLPAVQRGRVYATQAATQPVGMDQLLSAADTGNGLPMTRGDALVIFAAPSSGTIGSRAGWYGVMLEKLNDE
jgi:hypothetical protein